MVSMHLAWSQNGHWCLWLHLSHSSKVCIIIISLAVRITGDSGWFWSRQGTGNGGVSADHPLSKLPLCNTDWAPAGGAQCV